MFLSVEVCKDYSFLQVVQVVMNLVRLICFVVPIALIIMASIDLSKNVMSSTEDDMKKSSKVVIKRFIFAIAIFLVPTIVSLTMAILSDAGLKFKYADCITNSAAGVIESYKDNIDDTVKDQNNKKQTDTGTSSSIDGSSSKDKTSGSDSSGGNNKSSGSDSSGSGSTSYRSGASKSGGVTTISLDRSLVVIDNAHFNNATLKATVRGSLSNKKVTWSSSNKNIAKVSSNGVVKAVSGKSGTVTITAKTADGKTAKSKIVVIRRMYKQSNGKFYIEDEDFSNSEKESYINNAEKLCHSGKISNYPECGSIQLVYYTGSPHDGTLTKKTMNKKVGLSATNYLVFTSSIKQTITLMQKSGGKWKVVKSWRTSTGKSLWIGGPNVDGHYRFDYYTGCNYYVSKIGHSVLGLFWQTNKGSYRMDHAHVEPWFASRAIHTDVGEPLGYPRSAGCLRMKTSSYEWLEKKIKSKYGTRVIVF